MKYGIFQRFRNVDRVIQIVNVFARYGFKKEIQRAELNEFLKDSVGLERAGISEIPWYQRLACAFDELGPTFVKLGQLLASREELLPRYVISEFRRLQDRAKPLEFAVVQDILQKEYLGRVHEIFSYIDPEPLGSASIGQVHKAVLRDGSEVVLKIQRPGIAELIRTDISIMRGLAALLERIPELKAMRLVGIVDELGRSLFAELDYLREANNMDRMRRFFANNSKVYIPNIFRAYSTERVLCMEFVRGRKLTQLIPSPLHSEIVDIGVRAFLDMALEFGFFHADLHAGNFMLLDDGRLAILDFGLVARLSYQMRGTLCLMFISLAAEDVDTFSRLLLEVVEPEPDANLSAMQQEIRDLADSVLGLPLSQIQVGSLLMQASRICATYNAPIVRELVLFFRAIVALESFARTLDPDYDVLTRAQYHAKNMRNPLWNQEVLKRDLVFFARDFHALFKESPALVKKILACLQAGRFTIELKHDDMLTLARELDRASNRISLALILAGLVIAGSIITYGKSGALFDSLSTLGLFAFGTAGILGIWVIVSILRSGRYK